MMSFSRDAHAADLEMRAVLFILVAFAHIDGTFDGAERGFIRDVVDELSERRADELFGRGAPERADVLPRWKAHFYHVVTGMEHEVRSHLTESVAEGESSSQFVQAKLKLRCFELLGHLAPQNRAPLLQTVDRLMQADNGLPWRRTRRVRACLQRGRTLRGQTVDAGDGRSRLQRG